MGRRAPIRRSAVALAALAALAAPLILAGTAAAGVFTPEAGGSPNADDIESLYKLALYAAIPVFLAVEIALLWFLVRYRHRRGAVAAQIRGNTRLEIGWTVGASLILVVLTVFTFAKLSQIKNPPASGAAGLRLRGRRPLRLGGPARPTRGAGSEHRRQRPAVRVALHLSQRRLLL